MILWLNLEHAELRNVKIMANLGTRNTIQCVRFVINALTSPNTHRLTVKKSVWVTRVGAKGYPSSVHETSGKAVSELKPKQNVKQKHHRAGCKTLH